MDLSTRYLGLTLRTPLVASASPLSEEIDGIQRLEQAGASAVVLYSLFEEQLRNDATELNHYLTSHVDEFAEASSFFPDTGTFQLGPEEYLKHIEKAKKTVKIPIIASLNGTTPSGWVRIAKDMESAGADAIELNLYSVAADPNRSASQVEEDYLDVVRRVKKEIGIPLAVKLAPYFTSLSHFAKRLEGVGVNGLVLFNRFYQPDIDIEKLEIRSDVFLSSPQTLRLPLRWIGILYKRVNCDLAATGGVQGAADAIKMLMAGANVTMLCAILLRKGIDHVRVIESDLVTWMKEHEYLSVKEMQGSMSQIHCEHPSAFERAQYIKALKSFRPEFPK